MAYTVPSFMNNTNANTAPDLRSIHIDNINIPSRFTAMAAMYNDEMANNVAIVCDGGIDYNVSPSPPIKGESDYEY